jgi:chemotaxis protein CheD
MSAIFVQPVTQEGVSVVLGMGEFAVSSSPGNILACIGLGSCIAVCIYDRLSKIGGMVHVVLPRRDGPPDNNPGRYANIAVPHLLEQILKIGGMKNRITVKIAGGAQMTMAPGLRDTFKTGERNLAEVKAALERENVSLAAADVGGSVGRTVKMYVDTGKVTVKTVGGIAREL